MDYVMGKKHGVQNIVTTLDKVTKIERSLGSEEPIFTSFNYYQFMVSKKGKARTTFIDDEIDAFTNDTLANLSVSTHETSPINEPDSFKDMKVHIDSLISGVLSNKSLKASSFFVNSIGNIKHHQQNGEKYTVFETSQSLRNQTKRLCKYLITQGYVELVHLSRKTSSIFSFETIINNLCENGYVEVSKNEDS